MQRTKFRKRKVLIFEKMQKHVKQFLEYQILALKYCLIYFFFM
jgi:hypothetical protein